MTENQKSDRSKVGKDDCVGNFPSLLGRVHMGMATLRQFDMKVRDMQTLFPSNFTASNACSRASTNIQKNVYNSIIRERKKQKTRHLTPSHHLFIIDSLTPKLERPISQNNPLGVK